jgi:alkylhydroperoxidase family enzyme
LARRLGANEAWIAAARCESPEPGADDTGTLEHLDDSWHAAIVFAEQMTESGHAVSEGVYRELARHWDEGQRVEIALVAGLFAYFNRFNDALHVEVTR